MANLVCRRARFLPMQRRAPTPKGRNAMGCLAALARPSENRPGLNSFASWPHSAGS